MNDQDVMSRREQLSALADGELHEHEFSQAMGYAATDDGHACWQAWHLIGETLRSSQAPAAVGDAALLQRLHRQIAREQPAPRLSRATLQQVAPPLDAAEPAVRDPAANAQVLRWKLAAGFASLAAVAVLGWNAYVGLGQPAAPGAQLAAAPPVQHTPAQALVATGMAPSAGPQEAQAPQPIMIRDPRLDELLAAHRQLGNNTTALQMPAGFLRNATFAGRER